MPGVEDIRPPNRRHRSFLLIRKYLEKNDNFARTPRYPAAVGLQAARREQPYFWAAVHLRRGIAIQPHRPIFELLTGAFRRGGCHK